MSDPVSPAEVIAARPSDRARISLWRKDCSCIVACTSPVTGEHSAPSALTRLVAGIAANASFNKRAIGMLPDGTPPAPAVGRVDVRDNSEPSLSALRLMWWSWRQWRPWMLAVVFLHHVTMLANLSAEYLRTERRSNAFVGTACVWLAAACAVGAAARHARAVRPCREVLRTWTRLGCLWTCCAAVAAPGTIAICARSPTFDEVACTFLSGGLPPASQMHTSAAIMLAAVFVFHLPATTSVAAGTYAFAASIALSIVFGSMRLSKANCVYLVFELLTFSSIAAFVNIYWRQEALRLAAVRMVGARGAVPHEGHGPRRSPWASSRTLAAARSGSACSKRSTTRTSPAWSRSRTRTRSRTSCTRCVAPTPS